MSVQLPREHASFGRALAVAIAVCALVCLRAPGVTPSASAQALGPSVVVNQVDASGYPNLRAVVTVLTAAGVPAPALAVDAFKVVEPQNTDTASVVAAQDASLPLGIVIAIDTSGSMDGAPIASARVAAGELVSQLKPNDEASVVAFSDSVRVVVPFTSDHAALTSGIDQLSANGSTALYEAVEAAAYAARASRLPRQAVVLLTDGKNETQESVATATGSLDTARNARVPMFTVAYGADADTGYLSPLATETGGRAFAADELDVAQTYASIATLLRSQYIVSMRSNEPADGTDATLRISVNVDGQVSTSPATTFVRGKAPPPPVAAAPVAVSATTNRGSRDMEPLLIVIGAIVLAAVLLVSGYFLLRTARAASAQRERDRHAGQVSDESIPVSRRERIVRRATGRTIELVHLEGSGHEHRCAVGGTPLVIGSSDDSDIRLANDDSVAARHATVWLGDGRLRLRHTGGSRPTLLGGRPVEVMILDTGDEFTIGPDRFRVGAVSNTTPV
jgi:VWFA-related protein